MRLHVGGREELGKLDSDCQQQCVFHGVCLILSDDGSFDNAKYTCDMIHPLLCYLGIALSFLISFKLYSSGLLEEQTYFYLPIVLLISFYTGYAILTDKQKYQKRRFSQSVATATGKYIFWGLVLLGVMAIYRFHHPWYQELTTNTRRFLWHFIYAFAICGWPYLFLSDRYRYCQSNVMLDRYMTAAVLLRHLWRRDFSRFRARLASRQVKRMFISAALRIHYIPVMFEQVYSGMTNFMMQWRMDSEQVTLSVTDFGLSAHTHAFSWVLLLTTLAWLVDSNNAGIGYFWESRFTKTCFREMDPYPHHWVVTLACYIPFIYFVDAYVGAFPALPDDSLRVFDSVGVQHAIDAFLLLMFPTFSHNLQGMFTGANINHAIDILMVVVLLCYMASGSALSFSYSNLCYKKIQTRGIYGIIRHPAITFKIIWFTLAFYRFAPAYSLPWLFCYVFWMGIYIYRAFIEEQFLRRFPDYRVYMQKTRYRFIPGIA